MKRLICLILGAVLLAGCGGVAGAAEPITREEAERIALDHAGLSRDQVTGLRVEPEMDDGRQEFEVDFHSGGYEYDYTIHAATGRILSWDKDVED